MHFWDEFPECIFGTLALDLHPNLTVKVQLWDELPECIFGPNSLDLHPNLTVECLFGTQYLDPHSLTVVVFDVHPQ